jgi:zinc transport system permease protein
MEQIIELFQYKFFINAFLAAFLASVSCGIIGTYIVAKRIVFISGGITHSSFGGIGLGYFLGINPVIGATFFGLLSGTCIEYFSKKGDIREDSAIAILWSFGMAIGIIFISLTPGYAPNLMSYLFGNILTVSDIEIQLMLALDVLIIFFFIVFYKIILYLSFDEEYAKTHHAPVEVFNYLLIGLVALTIVINIRVVGIILVLPLLTIPQTVANLFSKNYKYIIFLAVFIAFVGSLIGLLVSYFLDIPSGAAIIFCLVIIFIVIKIFKVILTR